MILLGRFNPAGLERPAKRSIQFLKKGFIKNGAPPWLCNTP